MNRDRERDRAALPEPMRRDVRLLGDILGEIIHDSAGPELLADVERLRRAVIQARHSERDAWSAAGAAVPGSGQVAGDPAGDEIAALVASWSLAAAEQVARAFTVYFHLANLAEEHQRIRILRERDSGQEPVRESLAAAVAEFGHDEGRTHLSELLGSLRVHLVLTAHPTEARRRAVVAALRRISELLDVLDDRRAGAADHDEARRGLREQIDLLWRTSQLRVTAMDPIDEVRAVMAVFDETLFRVVPTVYRELDRALATTESGRVAPPVHAFLRFGSWVGADRDGNPFVTARVTREAASIQADHILRALENATTRIGRALTLHEETTPPTAGLRRALAAASAAHPDLLAEIAARSPQEPYRTYLLYAAQRINATRVRHADLAYPGPAEFLADLRIVQESLAAAGAAKQAFGELQHLIWQVETFGFHLAGLEVRQHSEVHAPALAELRAAGPPGAEHSGSLSAQTEEVLATIRAVAWVQDRYGVDACRRYVVSFTRSADDIEVGPQERAVEHVDRVRFPDQALGLVGAVRRLDAPQVNPHAERLGRLDRWHHVLVARDEDRVGDRPVPGQGLHVRPDLGVHALLLTARVQVAEPELDPGHLGDDPLVDGRHPVAGGVIPVDAEQFAADQLVGVLGDHLDQRDGVDPEIPARARPEQQFTRRGIDIADVHHDRVAGQDGKRGSEFGHHLRL